MIDALLPLPIQIVVDDVGWRLGMDGHEHGQPYRTGIQRLHGPEDYAALARLGRLTGTRPQAAFVLCEWDIRNRLRAVPTSQWMGAAWDNSANHGAWMEASAQVVRDQREHLELIFHGIGHEFWPGGGGRFERAEMHDKQGNFRGRAEAAARLDLFAAILDDHRLGTFPTAYIPCAAYHHAGGGLSALLRERGVRTMSTPYCAVRDLAQQRLSPWFTMDDGVLLIERGNDPVQWNAIAPAPLGAIDQPILGFHWPAFLHADPARNDEVVDAWAAHILAQGRRPGRWLAPSTEAHADQLAHHALTTVAVADGALVIDARRRTDVPYPATGRVVVDVVAGEALAVGDPSDPARARVERSVHWQADGRTVTRVTTMLAPGCDQVRLPLRAPAAQGGGSKP